MSVYFLDSSALVKRYVTERGSLWVRRITAPSMRHGIIIARITWVEVLSALARRQREGNLPPDDVNRVVQSLRYDIETQYQIAEIGQQVVEKAGNLVMRHPLRAYDAVQLAAAAHIHDVLVQTSAALIFVSADDKLVAAAQAEGLTAENPNLYPD